MGSEADLDTEIKSLSILAEHPSLYAEFVDLGCASSLVSLLSHENTDIAIDAIEIINELTDDNINADQASWDSLVDAMLDADLLSLLHENLIRMDESNESDRAGVYHVLEVLENVSSRSAIFDSTSSKLIPWLLDRVQRKESQTTQNKQFATEILAILLQSSSTCRDAFIAGNGIDLGLQLLSPYRRKDPARGSEDEEMLENLFDCLVCCVRPATGKDKFVQAEGVELCLIMVHEGKLSKPRALRLLDHAMSGADGATCCLTVVDRNGLKVIFSVLAKKTEARSLEHVVGILASLLRSLPANSAARIRLLAKFEEKEWQSVTKLLRVYQDCTDRLASIGSEIAAEKSSLDEIDAEQEDEWLSRRLDAGLCLLQTGAIVLAWLAAEDPAAQSRIYAVTDGSQIKQTLQGGSFYFRSRVVRDSYALPWFLRYFLIRDLTRNILFPYD